MNIITLRNGSQVPEAAVLTTMLALEDLLSTDPIGFHELVMAARDREYSVFGSTSRMTELRLIEGTNPEGTVRIHPAVQDVVISAASGEGITLALIDPREGPDE